MDKEEALQKIKQYRLLKKDLDFWLKGKYLTTAVDKEKKKLHITFPDKTNYTTSRVEDYVELVTALQTKT